MTTQRADSGTPSTGKSMPEKPAIREPDKTPPVPSRQAQPLQQGARGEFGEGNYKATRQYNEGLKRHLETHDIDKEARDAAPKSRQEADDMKRAEEVGLSHARNDKTEVKKNA